MLRGDGLTLASWPKDHPLLPHRAIGRSPRASPRPFRKSQRMISLDLQPNRIKKVSSFFHSLRSILSPVLPVSGADSHMLLSRWTERAFLLTSRHTPPTGLLCHTPPASFAIRLRLPRAYLTTMAAAGTKRKLHGREFYESIGSPRFVLAPMVDQSEFVSAATLFSMRSPTDYSRHGAC